LHALDETPPTTKQETQSANSLIVGALTARLVTQAGWTARPETKSYAIDRPVVVIGIPRTGTTALHQLLSLDPQFQGVERWLAAAPMARPPRESWPGNPHYQAMQENIVRMHQMAPVVASAHAVAADQPDECLVPMAQNFCSNWFSSNLDVPHYDAWFRTADQRPSFARYADILRLIGGHDPRRWLLKNPSHLFGIDALLEQFPDACVVQTHRHPAQALASLTSLLASVRDMLAGRHIDRHRLLQREIEFWAEAVRRGMRAQDQNPGRFVNIHQPDIRNDPLAVVARIYTRFGLRLSAEAEQRMVAWAAENPPDGRSQHVYERLKDTPHIAERFAAYIERYGLAPTDAGG
jgi:hypothetical protein